jgi:hypothetical protein
LKESKFEWNRQKRLAGYWQTLGLEKKIKVAKFFGSKCSAYINFMRSALVKIPVFAPFTPEDVEA